MEKIDLGGTWELGCIGKTDKYNVNVPGTVLSELLALEKIENPYYRDNEYKIRELFWKDYVFEKTVVLPEKFHKTEEWNLVCEGLDTLAEVYVDDICIAKTDNMHRKYVLPFPFLEDKNEYHLKIVFRSVLKYMEEYQYQKGKEIQYVPCGCMKGNQLLRKAHSMFGWDWGPQLIDAGIYRDIYLEKAEAIYIEDVAIDQTHQINANEEKEVYLKIKTRLAKKADKDFDEILKISVYDNEKNQIYTETILPESVKEKIKGQEVILEKLCIVKNPKLWWPNGYGQQTLYKVCIELFTVEGVQIDRHAMKIGLRTLTVSQKKDQWGEEFAFEINGIKIFTKGGNYIPEDCMYTTITKERQTYLLSSCAKAGFNCIRVWGGGYYPTDDFYELCDTYGLIVWQDLMFACNVYDVTKSFAENIKQEVKEQVKRLRHHASLGLWCGNNEIESAWNHWGDFQKETKYLRADYIKQFEEILPTVVKELDSHTFYWPSSPSSGGCFDEPDDENRGDVHYWDVWHGQKPFTDYRKYYFRFCSEFGFQSFPSIKTIDTFTKEEDKNIFSKVMESHQKNDAANGKILYYLSENFKYPNDFEHLIYVTQILQGMAIKAGVDHWRQNRGRCMGSIIWQINDDWPVASWSSIDYYGRWKALHYFAKKFYAQIASSIRIEDNVSVYLENETFQKQTYKATLYLKNMNLDIVKSVCSSGEIEKLSSECVLMYDRKEFLEDFESEKEQLFLESEIILSDQTVLKETEVFVPYKYLNLEQAKLNVEVEEAEDFYEIKISSDVFAPFVELDFKEADAIFSDNYFSITNENPVTIKVQKSDIQRDSLKSKADIQKKLQIRTLRDTY